MNQRITSLDFGKILQVVQALGLVAGGCWVMFRYLAHENEAEKLAVEQQRLQYRQSVAVAQTQRQAEDARLREVQLVNEQAALALSVQHKSQDASLAQQRLANEQAHLTLQIGETQRRLRQQELEHAVRLQEQDIELKRHNLAYSSRYRFSRSFTLKISKVRDIGEEFAEYLANYSFEFTNKSQVPFELSLYVLDYYIGVPKQGDKLRSLSVQPIGSPLGRWNSGRIQEGAIAWQQVGFVGVMDGAAVGKISPPWNWYIRDLNMTIGGLGVGPLKPEQVLQYSDTYFVRAPRNAYISFILSYCFDRCANYDDAYAHSEWAALESMGKKDHAFTAQKEKGSKDDPDTEVPDTQESTPNQLPAPDGWRLR